MTRPNGFWGIPVALCLLATAMPINAQAQSDALFVDQDGDVGVGTSSPASPLHVRRTTAAVLTPFLTLENNGVLSVGLSNTATGKTWLLENRSSHFFAIRDPADGQVEFAMSPQGNVTITGSLTVGPGGCTGCDLVFSEGYQIESISEHAAYMWENRHLPAVGPTPEDQPMNLSQKTGGILNELEKAHIYIEQLHRELGRVKERLAQLEAPSAKAHGSN